MKSSVDEAGRTSRQGIDALLGEKDRVAGGFGELLDAGSDIDRVADEGELQLAPAADGSGDHRPGVDPDPDAKLPAEPLCNQTMNQYRGLHRAVGVIGQVVGGAEDRKCAVTEELVDMPTSVHDSRHDNLK